jgi:hypothetical protein
MSPQRPVALNPAQAAAYTYDMLVSLKKIAQENKQAVLAQLLHLAAVEAKHHADQDTSLPG